MFFLQKVKYLVAFSVRALEDLVAKQLALEKRLEYVQEALGRVEARQLRLDDSPRLADHEFRVFSQWGEDGIIQLLLRHIPIERKSFVEFGVDDYTEANTRFLLTNNNWAGLVLDSNEDKIGRLKKSRVYWGYNLKAVHAFVTTQNINNILMENGMEGEIGLLSIDIDGNDYWVWQSIEVVKPVIVIIEYNHRFGRDLAVTIPYDEHFDRVKAHPSRIYFGASLKAMCLLAQRKGYVFIGCNTNGVNAFFIRRDCMPDSIKEVSPEEGYVAGHVLEACDESGLYTSSTPQEDLLLLKKLPLITIE